MPGFTTCLLQILMDSSLNFDMRLSGMINEWLLKCYVEYDLATHIWGK